MSTKKTHHYKEAGIGVDHFTQIAGLQVPEDGGVVEEGEVDHVLALLKLGRVDPAHVHCLQARNISFILYVNEFYKAVLKVPNTVIMPT